MRSNAEYHATIRYNIGENISFAKLEFNFHVPTHPENLPKKQNGGMQKAAMSMSGFSNSPLGKDPLRYYEGDPYRARQEAVPGHLRETVDRRFQNGIPMPPQMTYGKRCTHTLVTYSLFNDRAIIVQ